MIEDMIRQYLILTSKEFLSIPSLKTIFAKLSAKIITSKELSFAFTDDESLNFLFAKYSANKRIQGSLTKHLGKTRFNEWIKGYVINNPSDFVARMNNDHMFAEVIKKNIRPFEIVLHMLKQNNLGLEYINVLRVKYISDVIPRHESILVENFRNYLRSNPSNFINQVKKNVVFKQLVMQIMFPEEIFLRLSPEQKYIELNIQILELDFIQKMLKNYGEELGLPYNLATYAKKLLERHSCAELYCAEMLSLLLISNNFKEKIHNYGRGFLIWYLSKQNRQITDLIVRADNIKDIYDYAAIKDNAALRLAIMNQWEDISIILLSAPKVWKGRLWQGNWFLSLSGRYGLSNMVKILLADAEVMGLINLRAENNEVEYLLDGPIENHHYDIVKMYINIPSIFSAIVRMAANDKLAIIINLLKYGHIETFTELASEEQIYNSIRNAILTDQQDFILAAVEIDCKKIFNLFIAMDGVLDHIINIDVAKRIKLLYLAIKTGNHEIISPLVGIAAYRTLVCNNPHILRTPLETKQYHIVLLLLNIPGMLTSENIPRLSELIVGTNPGYYLLAKKLYETGEFQPTAEQKEKLSISAYNTMKHVKGCVLEYNRRMEKPSTKILPDDMLRLLYDSLHYSPYNSFTPTSNLLYMQMYMNSENNEYFPNRERPFLDPNIVSTSTPKAKC